MGTSLDSDGKPFLHKDGKLIVYTRAQKSLAKIYTIKYLEIQLYTTMIIKTKLDPSTTCDQDNYLLTADFAFIHNNPNLKCHPTLINSNILCNNTNLPLILTNNSNPKICIPCSITISTTETINNLNYDINEITFNTPSHIPFWNTNTIAPNLNDYKPQHDTNAELHAQNNHANKINSQHSKTQHFTTDDHKNTSIKPFRPSNKIETSDSKQLPFPIKDPKIITSPTEVNYHRKVSLKDADIDTNTKDNRGHVQRL